MPEAAREAEMEGIKAKECWVEATEAMERRAMAAEVTAPVE